MQIVTRPDSSARWAFWGFMSAVVLAAVSMSIATLPVRLLWIAAAGFVVSAVRFAIAIVRMPPASRTLWSLIGAYGLLVAVLSLTI